MGRKNKEIKVKKSKTGFKVGFLLGTVFVAALFFGSNFMYQIYKKPAEILSLLNLGTPKILTQTWKSYKSDFIANSTKNIPSTYLAALAQVESSGNPLATPEWKLKWGKDFFKFFSPASTSVGLFQFTTPTFEKAKQYCIHDGKVLKIGPWYKFNSCWFNSLYLRVLPSHSIELTASYLDVAVKKILKRYSYKNVSSKNKKRVASIIHLCGPGKAKRFVRSGFKINSVGRCGSHSSRRYIETVERYERQLIRKVII